MDPGQMASDDLDIQCFQKNSGLRKMVKVSLT